MFGGRHQGTDNSGSSPSSRRPPPPPPFFLATPQTTKVRESAEPSNPHLFLFPPFLLPRFADSDRRGFGRSPQVSRAVLPCPLTFFLFTIALSTSISRRVKKGYFFPLFPSPLPSSSSGAGMDSANGVQTFFILFPPCLHSEHRKA